MDGKGLGNIGSWTGRGLVLALTTASMTSVQAQVIEEIVVTAQKREQSLQDTPVAVTALTALAIEHKGIDNLADIEMFTPNLVFDTTAPISGLSSGAVVFIRGIGNTDFSLTTDPGVGTYVDGVYMSRSVGGVLDVLDVERIEVLRGPQGTLFGRNTMGGAINITSRRPADTFGGQVSAVAGNFDRLDLRAALDVPVSDTLLTSIAVSKKERDGFVRRVLVGDRLGDEDRWAMRATALFEPTESLRFQLSYDLSRIDENSAGSTVAGFTDGASVVGYNLFRQAFAPDAPDLAQFVTDGRRDRSFATGPTGTKLDIDGLSLIAAWGGESWELKYTGSWRKTEGEFFRDPDNTPVAITHTLNTDYQHEQITHELQLTGSLGTQIQYVAGVYWLDEDGRDVVRVPVFLPNVDDPNPANWFGFPAAIGNFADVDNRSKAAYAQLSWALNDRLTVTGGLRWSEDRKAFAYTQYIAADIEGGPLPVPISAVNENGVLTPGLIPIIGNGSGAVRETFDDTTVKLGVDYRLQDDTLLYYSFSQGFKSGGFVLRYVEARPEPLSFDPEFVNAHEVGVKWQGFGDRLRINTALFHMDYEDVQVTFFDRLGGPITANAGEVEIRGFEFEVTAVPVDQLRLEAAWGYNRARYTRIAEISGLSLAIDRSARLVNTPKHSVHLGGEWEFLPGGAHSLAARVDFSYTDDIFNDSQNSPFLFQSAYQVWNAALRYTAPDQRWGLTLFGQNLGDKRFIVSGDSNFGLGFHETNFNRPREYGVRAWLQL